MGRILGFMDHTARDEGADDLVSALEVIEAQPLATRAAAYESLHDSLVRKLDADPSAPTSSS